MHIHTLYNYSYVCMFAQIALFSFRRQAAMWERRWPDLPNGWGNWYRRGAADTAAAAVDTAAAAAEDAWADFFSRRPNYEFDGLRVDMSELQRIKDEGSEEEDEPRIDMSKLDEEEDGERDRSWIHYNRHVLREYGPRVDTMRSLWYHNVSRCNKAYFNWRRSRYNEQKRC